MLLNDSTRPTEYVIIKSRLDSREPLPIMLVRSLNTFKKIKLMIIFDSFTVRETSIGIENYWLGPIRTIKHSSLGGLKTEWGIRFARARFSTSETIPHKNVVYIKQSFFAHSPYKTHSYLCLNDGLEYILSGTSSVFYGVYRYLWISIDWVRVRESDATINFLKNFSRKVQVCVREKCTNYDFRIMNKVLPVNIRISALQFAT